MQRYVIFYIPLLIFALTMSLVKQSLGLFVHYVNISVLIKFTKYTS